MARPGAALNSAVIPHVSAHAIERYQQRVADVSDDEAREALSSPTIRMAIHLGACGVILRSGHRVVIDRNTIVTIVPTHSKRPKRYREIDE